MKKTVFIFLAAAAILFGSCDKVKETTSTDIAVDNVKFDFTAVTNSNDTAANLKSAAQMNTFSATRTVELSEIGSPDVIKHADKISKVMANSSLLGITASPAGSYTVSDLTISSPDVAGAVVVPSYTIGDAFVPPSGMEDYTSALIMKLLVAKAVTVTVSGATDAPEGAVISISYENDLVFTVEIL